MSSRKQRIHLAVALFLLKTLAQAVSQLLGVGPHAECSHGPSLACARYVRTRVPRDYGVAAAKYVDAFLQNVNWEEVNWRADSLSRD